MVKLLPNKVKLATTVKVLLNKVNLATIKVLLNKVKLATVKVLLNKVKLVKTG